MSNPEAPDPEASHPEASHPEAPDPEATRASSRSTRVHHAEPVSPWMHQLRSYLTPLGFLLATLVLCGIYLRLRDFGYPKSLQFDEHHFVETARGYLRHQPDWNDHPPLGKLVIAASIAQFGDSSVALRIPALISGFLVVLLGAIAAHRLFGTRWAAPAAAALLSADGFLIAYSRAALLDGFLAAASAAALAMVTFEVSLLWGCIAGLVLGISASVKFSGVAVAVPLLFALALSKRGQRERALAAGAVVAVAAFVYFSTYSVGLGITGKPDGLGDVVADTRRLLKHHAELTDMKNPATSGWITWALPIKPLMLGFEEKNGAVRALSTLGNLATWWSGVILALLSLAVVLRRGWSAILAGSSEPTERKGTDVIGDYVLQNGRAVLAALLLAIAFVAPWVVTHRDSYIYHFLPAYVPLVVNLAGLLAWYESKQPRRVFAFVVVSVIVTAFYAPLWAYVPMSHDALNVRLFFPSWR